MNPSSQSSSSVSALPLLSPVQAPGAGKKLSPVPGAVRQMLFEADQQRVPIAWSYEQWHCPVRRNDEKGKQ
jgi:hypothetical protein